MLDQSEIVSYLLSLGVVKARDAVADHLSVVDASRRNSVFVVASRGRPTFVVKQAHRDVASGLEHEAVVLRMLARSEIAASVPVVVDHDARAGCLVLRAPGGTPDWTKHHARGRFPTTTARALGRMLATLHTDRGPIAEVEGGEDRMWGLSFPEPPYELVLGMSAQARELLALVQATPDVCERLLTLRDDVIADAFVHGDLRWDNCLAVSPPGGRRRTRVVVIDWEVAGRGSAALDLGTAIGEYVSAWVTSIPITAPDDPGRCIALATTPIERMRPAVHALCAGYRAAGGELPPVRRAMEMTAVRLLQTAVERANALNAPPAHLRTLLNLAAAILREPEGMALSLLRLAR